MNSLPEIWLEHDRKIRPYLWSHRVLGITSKIVSLGLFISFLISHRFERLENWLQLKGVLGFPMWIAYFFSLALVWELAGLPFAISHHWVERENALSKQGYGAWFLDRLKGYAVGGVIGSMAIAIIYFSIDWSFDYWWVVTASCFVLLSVVLAQLAPIILIPIFFKLKPLEEGELRKRLLELSGRFNVQVKEVYHLGMGEKTEKGNAAFVGIGKTKRILIGDTLYEKFPIDEVEAVFAHELGHQVHGDLIKGILLSSLLLFVVFGLTNQVVNQFVFPFIQTDIRNPFGVVLFFVVMGLVNWPLGVIQNLFSRSRERMADQFAKNNLQTGNHLASALERLTFQNRGLFKPNSVIEWFSYSHPAPWRRITTLKT